MKDNRLVRENKELRRRLAEAEDALRAIREGQVDAIVVDGAAGAQVFSLSGSDTVYRLAVETMNEAVVSIAPEGTIIFCNIRFAELVSAPVELLLGRDIAEFVPAEEREAFRGLLRQCCREPVKHRVVFCGPSGTRKPALLNGISLTQDDTVILCLVIADLTELEGFAQHVEELRVQRSRLEETTGDLRRARQAALNLARDAVAARRQAEQAAAALRDSEEQLRFAQTSAGAGTWDWHIPGGKIEWSGELFRLFGMEAAEGKATFDIWRNILHPGDRDIAEERIDAAIKNRTLLDSDYRIVLPEGETRWIRAVGRTHYDAGGAPLRMSGICMDITDRKRTENELGRLRNVLAEAQKIAHLGSFEYIAATRATVWSEEEYRIYGLDPAQPSPEYDVMLARCIHPGDAALLHETFANAIRDRSVYELEHRIVRPDGSVRWVYDIAHPYFDDKGGLARYIGATLDITERHLADERLLKETREIALANRILRLFMEESGDDLFDKALSVVLESTGSRHGVFGYISEPGHLICPSLSKMLAACEIEGKCIHYPPEKWKGLWAQALRKKQSLYVNEAPPVPAGHVPIANNLATPIIFQDRVIGLLNQANKRGGYTEDDLRLAEGIAGRIAPALYAWIQKELRESERKKALEAQANALKRYEFLALTASGLLQLRDMQEAVEFLCAEVMHFLDCHVFFHFLLDAGTGSLRLNAWAGIEPEEAKKLAVLELGDGIYGCVARDGRRMVVEHIPDSTDERARMTKSFGIQACCCHPLTGPDGRTMGVLFFGTRSRDIFSGEDLALMQAAANQVAIAIVRMKAEQELREYRDRLAALVEERTEELRKSQEQLLHAQKMDALGQFAGGIAHDFNNMMQVVSGFAYRTLRALDFDHPLRNNVERIRDAAQSASNLTHQLLAFGRRQILQPRVFSLNDLVLKTLSMLGDTLGEDIEVSSRLQPGLGNVKADAAQLQQVMMNMAINARKAMPRGGKLVLETSDVVLGAAHAFKKDAAPAGRYVMLAVSDTGCGMTREILDKIFEPFFTTRSSTGAGLGLATAYGTVRQSGGVIRVYSEPGAGTTFKIFLPRTEEPLHQEEPVLQQIPGAQRNWTVLVAEDNPMALEFASLELSDRGYRTLRARSAEEAFSVSDGHHGPIHLLLTDVVLPAQSGRELAQALCGRRPEMAVLYMTGYDEDLVVKQGKLEPGTRLLSKPFSPEQLDAAVYEAIHAAAREKSLTAPDAGGGGAQVRRVLVVEDMPGMADIIAQVLRDPECTAEAASDGTRAIELAAALKPHFVLMDIKLPDMDGYALARRLREMSDGIAPYIIAASGCAPESGEAAGVFDEYIAKPVDFDKLKELIKSKPIPCGQ